MKYKKLEKNGRTLRVYEDGRVYRESYTLLDSKGVTRYYKENHFTACVHDKGHLYVGVFNKKIKKNFYIHRLVAECFLENYSEKLEVDHIDGNKKNNNTTNLRMATRAENARGFQTKRKNTPTKYLGVYLDKDIKEGSRRWYSTIGKNKKYYNLGFYHTEEEAALAYNQKALELGFAPERLNVIDD